MSSTRDESLPLSVAERILRLKQDDETATRFAQRVGLSPQVISNYKAGLHGASLEAVARVAANTTVNVRWLLTGEGSPYDPPARERDPYVAGISDTLDRIDRLLLRFREEYDLED